MLTPAATRFSEESGATASWVVNAPKQPAGTELCSSGVFVPATCWLSHRGCPSAVAQARVAAPSAVVTSMVRMMAEAESRKFRTALLDL
jgi:hypothetical protein